MIHRRLPPRAGSFAATESMLATAPTSPSSIITWTPATPPSSTFDSPIVQIRCPAKISQPYANESAEMGDHADEDPAGCAGALHAAYLGAMASQLPRGYATEEAIHLTLAYFAIAGLSLIRGRGAPPGKSHDKNLLYVGRFYEEWCCKMLNVIQRMAYCTTVHVL